VRRPARIVRTHPRGTTSVTTAQVSAACYGLLSHMGVDGGVLCRMRLFLFMGLFMWWCVLLPLVHQPVPPHGLELTKNYNYLSHTLIHYYIFYLTIVIGLVGNNFFP
jgi:hypothetical protein